MDSLPTPLRGKANDSKPKLNKAAKMGTSEAQRQNRVFGTTRNTNIIPGNSATTNITVPKTQPTKTRVKKSRENVNPGLKKKSDTFLEEKTSKKNGSCSSSETKTPVTLNCSKSSTPFYSAINCSKCRFDRLETSSYWVVQIKMAESVGKHFVASNFFRLAFESQAEPIRKLRMELRRYLLRHGYLSEQKEWREVAAKYGLLNLESNTH